MKRSKWALPYFIFLVLFVLLPLIIIAVYAFRATDGTFTMSNISAFFTKPTIVKTFWRSMEIAVENTLICLVIGYPVSFILADKNLNKSAFTAILFILPMWINALMRTIATAEIFHAAGLPLGRGSLLFGMAYDYLPFMIYPIYTVLNKMDKSYSEAARDLGASSFKAFTKVTLPLSIPGIMSGVMMVFMPTVSTFAVAEILTRNKIQLFGSLINEQFNNMMWGQGAALSLIMLVIVGLTTLLPTGEAEETEGGTI